MQDKKQNKVNYLKVEMVKRMLTQVQPPQAQVLAQVGDDDFIVALVDETSNYDSPATAPENSLDSRRCIRCRLSSKCRVCSSGRLVFPTKVTRGFISNSRGISRFDFIFLSFSRFPANKINCFVPSASPSGCQAQGVRMI